MTSPAARRSPTTSCLPVPSFDLRSDDVAEAR